jgi:hypothetical protein
VKEKNIWMCYYIMMKCHRLTKIEGSGVVIGTCSFDFLPWLHHVYFFLHHWQVRKCSDLDVIGRRAYNLPFVNLVGISV